ncbi:hypothetical protein VUR80DRAFT_231 [Thermomyces stellatus]
MNSASLVVSRVITPRPAGREHVTIWTAVSFSAELKPLRKWFSVFVSRPGFGRALGCASAKASLAGGVDLHARVPARAPP